MQRWNKNKVTPPHQKATSAEPSATLPVGCTNHALGVVTFPVGWASGFLAHADERVPNSVGKSKTNLPTLRIVEGHEQVPSSVDQWLRWLTGKLVNTWKKHIWAVLLWAAMMTTPSITSAETPASSSVSASASADKGVGVWQYASNGQKFEDLVALSTEEMGKLPFTLRMEIKKWKQVQLSQEVVSKKMEDSQLSQEVVSLDQGILDGEKTIIVEYQKMIDNFHQLHNEKNTSPIYFTIKEDLKKALLTGKPPEILPQLESIRSILMS